MKKTYFVEEIASKTFELEGTEAEIQEYIDEIMSDPENMGKDCFYSYEATEIGSFEDEVQKYLDKFTPKWCIEDLKAVLENEDVPPTKENIKRFMEMNPNMSGFRGLLIEDWFERMSYLVYSGDYETRTPKGKWEITDMATGEVITFEVFLMSEYNEDDITSTNHVFEYSVNGKVYYNYQTFGDAMKFLEGISYDRKVQKIDH